MSKIAVELRSGIFSTLKGGPGSGHHGHRGRPGEQGGSLPGNGAGGGSEFDQWFAGSQVVDREGQPLPVYHGSRYTFDTFDAQRSGGMFFFATDRKQAELYGDVREFYLQSRNLLDLTNIDYTDDRVMGFIRDYSQEFDEWVDRSSGEEMSVADFIETGTLYDYEGTGSGRRWRHLFRMARNNGYDGVKIYDVTDGVYAPVYVVFDPSQIRLVTQKGGRGSGHHGHRGRPGKRGGSLPGYGLGPADGKRYGIGSYRPGIFAGPAQGHVAYATAEDARLDLISRTEFYQDHIKKYDKLIKEQNAKLKEIEDRGGVWSSEWYGELRLKRNYQKLRKKVARELDKAVLKWMTENTAASTQISPSLNPLDIKEMTEILRPLIDHIRDRNGNKPSPEERETALVEVATRYAIDPLIGIWYKEDLRTADQVAQAMNSVASRVEESQIEAGRMPMRLQFCLERTKFGAAYVESDDYVKILPTDYRGTTFASTVHEIGHWLEARFTDAVRKQIRSFFEQRTAGEILKPISQTQRNIMVKKDKFLDPYTGREYEDGTTEVFSNGLEMFITSTYRLAVRDPGHFRLVFSVLRGIPEQ